MFESLEDRIEQDEKQESSKKDRMLHYVAIGAIAMMVAGGLAAVSQYVK